MKSRSKRILLYKILGFGFAAFLFLMPTNLSALPDSDLRVIVSSLGVDISGETVSAYASIILPDTAKSANKSAKGEGSCIAEAISAMSVDVGRKLELGQCELVVLGSGFVSSGNYSALEYLLSSGTIGAGAAVIYAEKVEDFIASANKIESNAVTGLNSFVVYSRNSIYAPSTTLLDLLSSLKSVAKACYLPQIKMVNIGEETKIDSVDTAALLNYDNKIIMLESGVTRGITWLDRYSDKGQVQLDNFEYKELKVKGVPADLKDKKVSMTAKFVDGKPVLKIKIDLHFALKDSYFLLSNSYTQKEISDELGKKFSQKVKSEINTSIATAAQISTDFLNITQEFYRHNPKQLKSYQGNLLNDLRVEYNIYSRVK